MPDNNTGTSGAIDFIRLLFHGTERPVYFSSLANDRAEPGQPGERNINTRDGDDVARFVGKWDRRGRGTFFCVATIEGGTRNKDAARELPALWSDVDYKGIDPAEDVATGLSRLRHPPSLIVSSGHGAHLYWLLKEPADAQADQRRVETVLRQLADMVAGDLQVCEVARLMRLPGTHNTKGGEWIPVTAVQTRAEPYRYTLEELEDWLAEAAPVLRRKTTGVKSAGIDARAVDDNPWLRAAQDLGYKPRVDVAARLEGMTYGGAGEAGVHATQLSVSAALLNAGQDAEEVVALLLEATAHAAGDFGARWDWRREEAALRRMCVTWLEKHPPQPHPKKAPDPQPEQRASKEQDANDDENVVDLGAVRAKRKPKVNPKNQHRIVAETFLRMLEERGETVLFTRKGTHRYPDNLWRLEMDDDVKTWLEVEMERVAQRIELESTNRLISEARNYILRHPALHRENVPFDAHGQVSCRSGLVNPLTGIVTPPAREHFATWRIECDYVPTATCPWWHRMLADVFADREPAVAAECIALVQEVLGMGLIDTKPRDLSRALVLQGGSNAGKSGLLEVMGGLFGSEVNTTGLERLDDTHAMMPFARRVPWVLHEAFDAGKWHFSATVKAIITGEPVQINMKGGRIFTTRITAPILWATNAPPQFREATKAITNRILVLECRREFEAEAPVGAAAEALRRGFHRPSRLVLETELEGVFAWAVEGLRRALARGHFVLPQDVQDAAHAIRRDSNLVAGFIEDCTEYAPDVRVSTADFWVSFGSWWMEHKDSDRSIPSGERVGTALRALADPLIATDRGELRENRRRYYAGFRLNAIGVGHWENGIKAEAFAMKGRTSNATAQGGDPNGVVPDSWHTKKSIMAMRLAHGMRRDRVTGDDRSENGLTAPDNPLDPTVGAVFE